MKEHIGEHYDRTSDFQQLQFDKLVTMIRESIPDLGEIRSILDIGSGTGSRTKQCFDIFPHLEHITAIDPDWEMIEVAEKKYADPRIAYRKMTAKNIPQLYAEKRVYDLALSNWTLHWVDHKTQLLKDLHNLVRPKGYFAMTSSQALPSILRMIDEHIRIEFRVPDASNFCFHEKAAAWHRILSENEWNIIAEAAETAHRDLPSAKTYLEHWFTSSATKSMYGKHLIELSPLTRSDILFLMERAFPPETPGMELSFTEDVIRLVAQKD